MCALHWDTYEAMYLAGVERHALAHPEDPEAPAMLERIRAWNQTYHRYGRHELGFGVYLMRKGPLPSRRSNP